jgi:hypothetical protein
MDLDIAHRLSLIQRNLEAAQVNIDSANELMRIVIEELTGPGSSAAAFRAETPAFVTPAKKEKRSQPAKKKAANNREIIREFVKSNGGTFTTADVLDWAKKQGYAVKKDSLYPSVHGMAHEKKEIAPDGQGGYKKVA